MMDNPFDAYGDPEDVPASEGLQPGPAPSLWESFKAGAGNVLSGGGLLGAARTLADSKTMNRTDVAQPGDSPFAGKPSQGEVDAARHRYEQHIRDEESYAAFHSDTIGGKAAGLLGSVAAGALLPENFLSAGGLVSGGVSTGLRAAGSTGALARIFGGAAEAGVVNTGIDAAAQGLNVAAGLQDGYDPKQGALSFGVGAALGGGMHAIAEGVGRMAQQRRAIDGDISATGEAVVPPVPGTTDTAPALTVHGSPFGTLDRTAFAKPTEPARPVVAPDPQAVATRDAAIQAAAAIPDKTLDKVAGAIVLADPNAGTGTVRVPLSIEEGAALKQAGITVADDGNIPAAQAAGLLAERNRRDAADTPDSTAAEPPQVVETSTGTPEPQGSPVAAIPANAEQHTLRGDLVPSMTPHRVSTPDGKGVEVAPIVVEARDLKSSADAGYDATLQPRQRDRAASQAQIRDMASNLDPERLGFSAEADRGAPIIAGDGTVESGNGRILAVRSAYDQGGEAAQRYRDWLAGQGVDVAKYDQPVLVRQRLTDLSPEDRQAFTVSANQAATLSMSASEKALADSHIITPTRLDLLRNADDLGAASNAEFRRAFVGALPASERGAMTAADGSISAEGLTRIRNAVLASAYGDSPVLARIAEATHDEVKSISNALTAAAPEWARLKADIAEGRVPTDFDLRADLLEAVQRTADLRAKGTKLADQLAQVDAFDRMSSRVEQFLRLFSDPSGRKAAGAERITDALRFYAEEARKVSAERGLDLGLAPIRPDDIQGEALVQAHQKANQAAAAADRGPTLFERGRRGDGESGGTGRGEARRSGTRDASRSPAGPGDRGAGSEGRGRGRASGRDAARSFDGLTDERAQALRAEPMAPRGGPTTAFDPDARFPNRRALAGETTKPRQLPADATPEEVHAFRVTDAMRGIAARMDRKLEVDRRFNTRGSLGEYKPKEGVLRIRQEGDAEVFAHELGHAVDQRLANADTGPEWQRLRRQFADELKPLDANATDPAKKTVNEGLAEFLRSYITNPAYARKQAPGFAAEFDRLVATRDPELADILSDAARMSQIDSGMAPVDVFRTMIAPGSQPRGLAKFRDEARRLGFTPTLSLWYDRMYAAVVSPDHWAKRFQDQLREARFQKTGTPLPEFGWSDPYKMMRGLPGARQAALDSVYYGVRGYGSSFRDAVKSPAIYDALAKAFDGHVTLIEKPDHPLVKAFSGYLIARRAAALYDRFKAGDIRNPPVRASEAETHGAIADFETHYPQFRDAAEDVFAFNDAMWRKKFEAGLIGRDLYETVAGRGDAYVPFFRDLSDSQAGAGSGGSSGTGQEHSVVKRLQGSSRQIIDPLHSLIYDAVQTERIIALNDTIKAMHDLAKTGGEFSGRFLEQVPNTELRADSIDIAEGLRAAASRAGLEKADAETMIRHIEGMVGDDLSATVFRATQTTAKGERIAFYWNAGERVALKFGNDEVSKAFFDSVSSMSTSERDLLLAMFGKINGLFSQLITQAPQFAIKNLLVDNMSRVFMARNTGVLGRIPGAAIAMGLHSQILDREFAKAYAAFGGHRGGVVAAASRDLAQRQGLGAVTLRPKTLSDMGAELTALLRNPKDLALHVFASPLHALEGMMKIIEGTETTGRLGQAKIVYRYLKKQGLNDEEAFHAALYESRDVLDYDRRGTGMQAAIKTLVFLNPAVQATERSARNLFGEPVRAAVEAYRRGGYANLDEASKTALADAVKNYGMIALGTVATAGYYFSNADNPVYQRATPYMRRRYYIFDAGQGADGRQMVVTVPKPFDHAGGIFGAIEAGLDGIRRGDPQGWANVRGALLDGFLPRQVSSLKDFITGNPFIKTAFEAETGMRLGFEDKPPMPIVPESLKSLPPDMQYTGYTSFLAKTMGEYFGISPVMADHVMSGIGGTATKDVSNLVTAVFDNQPNVTVKDAMTRMFFGALYREQGGGGDFRSDLMDLMGRSNGTYAEAAAGYMAAIKDGDSAQAAAIYARSNDTAKALMTMRSATKSFPPELRQLHPLERTATIGDVLSKVTRDLASSHLQVQDHTKGNAKAQTFIELEPTTARAIINTVGSWMAEEMRNGLSVAKEPGYQNFGIIDTAPRLDAIYAADPDVGAEITKRLEYMHVLPMEGVAKAWPEVESRLLKDREKADLGPLLPAGHLAPRRRSSSKPVQLEAVP